MGTSHLILALSLTCLGVSLALIAQEGSLVARLAHLFNVL
jgi:hypothetical protein